MAQLKLTVGFSHNPRIEPLIDGTVKPQNIELDFVLSHPGELFYRNLKYDEFDVFEMSISDYLISRERREKDRWRWSALPVFLSKALMWLNLFVNTGAKISQLGDLKGRRVGVPDYPMTAALWMRIVLKELYGVRPTDIFWHVGRLKELSHGGLLGLDRNPPPGVSLSWLTEEQTLDTMLDRGELDAAYGFLPGSAGDRNFRSIDRYGGTPIEGNPRIKKLFEDGGRGVIVEYFKRTGAVPTNHMVAVQNRLLDEHPWAALELYKAFQRSKEVAYERAGRSEAASLLFAGEDRQKQAAVFGRDPFPQGLRANRKMLEILFRSSSEEGLTRKPATAEEIFYRSTLDT
jgi:4,5-dihydroxyphthalate decarboxylase